MAAKYIGAHVPTQGGLGNSLRAGHAFGCTAIQVFTSSPRQWKANSPTPAQIADFKRAKVETGIEHVVSHDTYLVNLVAPTEEIAIKSFKSLKDELIRCSSYGIDRVVSHLGSYKGQDPGETLLKVSELVVELLGETPEDVMLLMETTAGQGSSLNSRFEEIAAILELTKGPKRFGVCLDTCHVFAAGYEMRTLDGYTSTFERFESLVGIDRLMAIHVNDSLKPFNSRVDRHADIGEGEMGPNPFRWLVNDPRFTDIPMMLETDAERHPENLARLRSYFE